MSPEIKKQQKDKLVERPPVVVVMGHVDHGKSTLLDYIRKTNVVAGEAGGITQRISAYEVEHKDEGGNLKKITFLDTPGHAAFSQMRERGAYIADVAILIVAADDGVKDQTIEAWGRIKESGIPLIVAINKIDKPEANPEKTKKDLAEHEIFVEGYGGDIPAVEISAKKGTGVDELLDLVLITVSMEELRGDPAKPAEGFVIESDVDPKRGISSTLVIKDGTLRKGMFVIIEDSFSVTRILENFLGENIDSASFSSPVRVVGFSSPIRIPGLTKVPTVGARFVTVETKIEAQEVIKRFQEKELIPREKGVAQKIEKKLVPLVIKADVAGSLEAIEKEVKDLAQETVAFKIIQKGVGAITEKDIGIVAKDKEALIVGFNVSVDPTARELNEQAGIPLKNFDVIYELTDWLKEELEKRRPRIKVAEEVGKIKVLKFFSQRKDKQVIGGEMIEGKAETGSKVYILRRGKKIGEGEIRELEKEKKKTSKVQKGQFGMLVKSEEEIAPGDVLEVYIEVEK